MNPFKPWHQINKRGLFTGLVCIALSIVFGCTYLPLKGGHSRVGPNDAVLYAPQNPKDGSRQIVDHDTDVLQTTNGAGQILRSHTHTETTIGAAQKDTAREIGAKLASMRWMQWIGIVVFLFGAASMFYPPLKLIVASVTTSMAACAAGLTMMILPVLLIGNETLIIASSLAAMVGWLLWFFAHRHGGLQAEVNLLRNWFTAPPDRSTKAIGVNAAAPADRPAPPPAPPAPVA